MTACDKELLVSYLYDECDGLARRRLEAHLDECAACAREVRGFEAVRQDLTCWAPPERELGFAKTGTDSASGKWGLTPFFRPRYAHWGFAAAAVLVLAAAVGLANLEIRYGPDGVVVRTGWRRAAPAGSGAAPWQTDLAALERRLRGEFAAAPGRTGELRVTSAATTAGSGRGAEAESRGRAADADLVRRVRALIEESERRQQRELALQVGRLVRENEAQRRADLLRIQQGFGQLEGFTGAEVARQREMLNYLVRVSAQPR